MPYVSKMFNFLSLKFIFIRKEAAGYLYSSLTIDMFRFIEFTVAQPKHSFVKILTGIYQLNLKDNWLANIILKGGKLS